MRHFDGLVRRPVRQRERQRKWWDAGGSAAGVVIDLHRKSWVPAFVQARLGKDFFHDAISVAFTGAHDQSELFHQVARLGHIEQLTPHVSVRDEDIKRIAGLRRLKRFDLMDPAPELPDKALEVLVQMSSIEALSIYDASITDQGLAALANMRQLKELAIGHGAGSPIRDFASQMRASPNSNR